MSALCGRPMRRYEPVRWGVAVVSDPVCGRPAGHGGHCLSRMCLDRGREYARQRDRRRRAAAAQAQSAAGEPSRGRRIREVRQWAGVSQKALGAALGVSQRSVANWEADLFDPGAARLLEIAAATGAPVSWLLPAEVSRAA